MLTLIFPPAISLAIQGRNERNCISTKVIMFQFIALGVIV